MDKNTTVVFAAPLMSTIAELGTFLAREAAATTRRRCRSPSLPLTAVATPNGNPDTVPTTTG